MALQQAIDQYHDLLTPDLAAETEGQLNDQMRRRGLFFGDRPLCSVLRPRFLTPAQYEFLQGAVRVLLGSFDKVYRAAMEDPAMRAQFGLEDWEEELIRHDPGFPDASPVSRLDAFFVHDRGGLRFTEYNAETPAAASYNDILAEVFFGLPVMREFLKRYEVRHIASRHSVLHSLIEAHRHWSGSRERPRIAILDWREVPTYSEFVISAEYFRSQGFECVITDPREVEYRGGRLIAEGEPVDLIYKRVLISELIQRGGMDHPVVRAVADGAVCMVNPFRCKILHKKASLAVLSDERNAHMFDAHELEAIHSYIPWTRVVEERWTTHSSGQIDLLPFIHENRERLVLKPNDEYGGTGILLGWQTEENEWHRAVDEALGGHWVIQERIAIPEEAYPSMVDGTLRIADRILDTAPFVFHGRYMDGCLTRLSTEALVNVTAAGGSSLATFIAAPR